MSVEVTVPAVGESITEVTIGQWNKQDGDYVEVDEVLCELESDKATFELNAESEGILKILAEEGETVPVGEKICSIEPGEKSEDEDSAEGDDGQPEEEETKESPAESSSSNGSEGPEKTGEVVEMTIPAVGESITEVTIANWTKEDGDYVEEEEILCEIESDKATFELSAEASGILTRLVEEGETLEVGALVCKIEVTKGGAPAKEESTTEKSSETPAASNGHSGDEDTYATGHASPAAQKILAEKGIRPEEVKGTGVDGRITKEDAMKAEKSATKPQSEAKSDASKQEKSEAPTSQKQAGDRVENRKKMTSLRKTISRRLVSVKNETAMLTTFNEVDMQPVMDARKKYKEMFKEKHGVGLGFMSFFAKAVCQALLEWPAVNAQIDGEEMIYHEYCDISIAVSTPKGLVVPIIRNAESMSFHEIEAEIIRLATRARDGKLTIPEMTGGTFTITNGGVFGSMMSTPIINAPQSAILGMHNIVQRPMAVNGEVVIKPMMYIALSYDHRIIDGRESVSFLVRVKELLEDPIRLMLGV